jgi:putative ABC transport system permease protein
MRGWFWPALRRELRTSWTRLSLSALALILATAAMTSIILTDARLSQQTKKQADLVLGGDAEIFDVRLLPDSLLEKIQSSAKVSRKSRVTTFITMLNAGSNARPRLVEAITIDESWPLVPGMKVQPSPAYERLQQGGVWLERSWATNLELQPLKEPLGREPGEKTLQKLLSERKAIRIGKKVFPIVGLVENDQMRDFASFAIGARIYMARETALRQRFISAQSRVRDKFIVQFAQDVDLKEGMKWLSNEVAALGSAQPNLRSKEDALAGAFKPARSLFVFYDAIGFSLLVLLGLGCAQGIHSYLSRKHADARILTMLGAQRTHTALLYVGNVLVVAVISLFIGTSAGQLLFQEQVLPRLVRLTPGLSPELAPTDLAAIGMRFFAGVLILTLALVLPGAMLFLKSNASRTELLLTRVPTFIERLKMTGLKALSSLEKFPDLVWLFAAFLLSFLISSESLLNTLLVLFLTGVYLLVRISIRAIARFGLNSRFRLPLFFRLASSEIASRPTQSTLSLLLFCLSACLVVFLWDLRSNIVGQLTNSFASGTRPNIFVLDSPPESENSVREILKSGNAVGIWSEKLTRARIESINGKDPEQWMESLTIKQESLQRAKRLLNREQNLTSRTAPGADEQIISGSFWSDPSVKKVQNEVSVENGIAELLNIRLGDQITFNIQGVAVKVKVTSLRRVRWQSFRPNFLFVLHPSVLHEAPYSALIAANIQESKSRNDTMSALFQNHPGLTSIDANEFSLIAGQLVTAAVEIVRTLSLMLFAGALLNTCLTAWTSFSLRAKNFSLYRCLGANNALVMGSCLAEFVLMAVVGCVIGLGASWGLSAVVENSLLTADDQLNNSIVPSLSVGLTILALSTLIGLISALLILRQAPLRELRRPQ